MNDLSFCQNLIYHLVNPLIAGSLAEKPLSSIQAAESPERNLFPRREFDVVNSERGTGEVFTAYLRPVLSLSAHFDDGLLVYPEITGLDASVFYHMSGCLLRFPFWK